MANTIKKYWPWISTLLLLIVLASMFLWPAVSRPLSIAVMIMGPSMIVVLTIQRHLRAYRKGDMGRKTLTNKIAVDLLGILFTMAAAILAGGWAGRLAGLSAWNAGWPAWAVITTGILAGFTVGFGVGWLLRCVWKILFGLKHAKNAQVGKG